MDAEDLPSTIPKQAVIWLYWHRLICLWWLLDLFCDEKDRSIGVWWLQVMVMRVVSTIVHVMVCVCRHVIRIAHHLKV